MQTTLSEAALKRENTWFRGTGGRSEENHGAGFRPAFLDAETRIIYASRFVDGMPAPFHLLDGLPDDVVVARHPSGPGGEGQSLGGLGVRPGSPVLYPRRGGPLPHCVRGVMPPPRAPA